MTPFLAAAGPLLGRLLVSTIFLYSAYDKLFAHHGRAAAAVAGKGIPFATVASYGAGLFELSVGAAIVIGARTRVAAVASMAYLVVVTWLFHWRPAAHGDVAQLVQVLKNTGLAGGLLLLASHGPGPASVDRG